MKIVKQNITEITRGVIAHGCNCQGVMGSGAAKALRDRWPMIFPPYQTVCRGAEANTSELLGKAVIVNVGVDLYVANLFTQNFFGSTGVFASESAIEESLTYALTFAHENNLPLYAVKIGALRGGLDWETEVKPIYVSLESRFPTVDLIVCDL